MPPFSLLEDCAVVSRHFDLWIVAAVLSKSVPSATLLFSKVFQRRVGIEMNIIASKVISYRF